MQAIWLKTFTAVEKVWGKFEWCQNRESNYGARLSFSKASLCWEVFVATSNQWIAMKYFPRKPVPFPSNLIWALNCIIQGLRKGFHMMSGQSAWTLGFQCPEAAGLRANKVFPYHVGQCETHVKGTHFPKFQYYPSRSPRHPKNSAIYERIARYLCNEGHKKNKGERSTFERLWVCLVDRLAGRMVGPLQPIWLSNSR